MKINIGRYPKGNRERKVNIQIDHYDTWNLDHTLAKIIYPALLQLREQKQGVPSEFVEDVGGTDYEQQDSFDFYKETHKESFDKACELWKETLDKMIWSFRELAEGDYDTKYYHGKPEFEFVETEKMYPNPITGKMEKTYHMVDKNPSDHWHDSVGQELHEQRMQEGFELFGKYFRALWD